MAISKITGSGIGAVNAPVEFTSADNLSQLTLSSTDADANVGPRLDLTRNSASPADSDYIGQIRFLGEDSADNSISYVSMFGQILDVTDGTEDGSFELDVRLAGTNRSRMISNATETVLNDDSVDLDFRVESNDSANMLVVDAGNNRIGVGTATPSHPLHLVTSTDGTGVSGDDIWAALIQNAEATDARSYGLKIMAGSTTDYAFFITDHDGSNTLMEVQGYGHITMPLQPAFCVEKASTDQADIPVNTNTEVVFDTEKYDQNGDFSSNTFTAPVNGRYQLNVAIVVRVVDNEASYYRCRLSTSNKTFETFVDPTFGQDNAFLQMGLCVTADMDANDTAKVHIFQSGGSAQSDLAYGENYFSGFLAC